MKIFACGADRRRRREKLGILAVSTTKFNVFTEKKIADGYGHLVPDGGRHGLSRGVATVRAPKGMPVPVRNVVPVPVRCFFLRENIECCGNG